MQSNFDAVVFLVDYTAFSESINSYNLPLYGRTLLASVVAALGGAEHITVPYDDKIDVLDAVKQYASERRYTAALFSDTPLLRRESILSALAFIARQNAPCVRLPRGFVFDNTQLEKADLAAAPLFTYVGAEEDFLAVTDYKQLSRAGGVLRRRIVDYHLENGVHIIDPPTAYIDADAVIARDVTIYPNNTLRGATKIDKGARLRENNVIESSTIGADAEVFASVIEDSVVQAGAKIGPYAHLRPKSVIGRYAKIGNFVEVKNSSVGNGAKASHLSYIGDALVEADCNIGCGVTVANYDGRHKHRTIIGEGAFIGSNSVLVAPVTVGTRALVAAGSTITEDVEAGALAIGRARQVNKPDYAQRFLEE